LYVLRFIGCDVGTPGFSLVSLRMTAGDQRRIADPRDNPLLWAFSRRR
jgi:hypothetical protein